MNIAVETCLIFLILANLVLLGSSRLATCIHVLAAEGFALGIMPIALPEQGPFWHVLIVSLLSIGLKGIAFPWLLIRALREADVRHEVQPYVGYSFSLLIGILALGTSLWLAPRLALGDSQAPPLVLATAFFMVLTGLFLLVSRRNALNQVMGYLTLENGIYLFGLALVREQPLLVEMGVLLDVFVAVFVMGITMFHINREFDHLDVDQLSNLKD